MKYPGICGFGAKKHNFVQNEYTNEQLRTKKNFALVICVFVYLCICVFVYSLKKSQPKSIYLI